MSIRNQLREFRCGFPNGSLIYVGFVKRTPSLLLCCFGLALYAQLAACSAERVTGGPALPREQEILRYRSKNAAKAPVVFGQVWVVDNTGRYPLPTALVSVDGQPSYANETGTYSLSLVPGNHQFLAGQTGMRSARVALKVERGDSIQVNFYLRPDTRTAN
jgi:hypothetical protein